MNQICSRCGTNHGTHARFCQVCGATLGATAVDGHTVVVNPSPVPVASPQPQIDVKTIVQRAQSALGNTLINPNPMVQQSDQREETVISNDVSSSMASPYDGARNKLEAAICASINMMLEKAKIDQQDEIGLVSFNHHAQSLLPLCSIAAHRQQIIETLQRLQARGGTDINEGLKAARDLFDWHRSNVVRRIVLLTDGHGGHPLRTASDLKKRGVVIDVVGVGPTPSSVDEKLLKAVASVIDGELRYRFIRDQQTLVAHYTNIAGKTAVSA